MRICSTSTDKHILKFIWKDKTPRIAKPVFFFFFLPRHLASRILVPQTGIEPTLSAVDLRVQWTQS